DLTGDGKTVIKGGWGRFTHMWNADEINMANKDAFLTSTFTWHDNNGNKLYDPGEVNFSPNGTDFVGTSVLGASAAIANAVPNSKSNAKYRSFEIAASKRLSNRWLFSASYSTTKVNVPYVSNTMQTVGSACIGCVDLTTYDPNAEIFGANNTWDRLTRLS